MKEMIKKISLGVISALLVAISAVGVISSPNVYASDGPCDTNRTKTNSAGATVSAYNENECQACIGSAIADGNAKNQSDAKTWCETTHGGGVEGVWTTVRTAINWVLIAVGLICVIFMIIGGIKYATSGGDTEKVKNAKNTLLYAVIGLAVALLAGVIVNIVFDILGNVN